MKKTYLLRSQALALIFTIIAGVGTPALALAASSSKTEKASAAASINSDSLSIASGKKASITGTSTDVKAIRVTITKTDSSKVLFKSKTLKVKSGDWHTSVSKKLVDGTYTVTVLNYDNKKHPELAHGTLTVGAPAGMLSVSTIPLLGGGTASSNQLVPISYLQVRNTGTTPVSIKGFEVKQNGTAFDGAVIGFSSVDDKSGSQGSSMTGLVRGTGYVPSTAVIAAGERKLFTLKAQLASGLSAGQTLSLSVTGVDADATLKAAFPISGATWVLAR